MLVRRTRQRREIRHEQSFNHGADYSPREAAADPKYQRYFQQLDTDQYVKIVEKNILQSMVDFLDAHGIDAGELVERQSVIQNNGVYVTGGATVNANSIAAGKKSRAKNTGGQPAPSRTPGISSAARKG